MSHLHQRSWLLRQWYIIPCNKSNVEDLADSEEVEEVEEVEEFANSVLADIVCLNV